MFERFTDRARRVVVHSQDAARALNHDYIGTEHILLGLLYEGEGIAAKALASLGITIKGVTRQVEEIIGRGPQPPSGNLPFTPRARRVLEESLPESLRLGNTYIGTEHILLGAIRVAETATDGMAAAILRGFDVRTDVARAEVLKLLAGFRIVPPSVPGATFPVLDSLARDLTADARDGRLRPTVGREREIGRAVQILSRHTRSRPLLIGEAGVGKTSVVEGLAWAIARGEVPGPLGASRLMSLDWPRLAVTREDLRGTLARITAETAGTRDVILVLDGVTALPDQRGAAIIDSLLIDESRRVILITTPTEHARLLGAGSRIDRYCEEIRIAEPSHTESVAILREAAGEIEGHHKVTFTGESLAEAVTLADRYSPGRRLPTSAINLLDETGAAVRVEVSAPPDLREWDERLAEVRALKERAIDDQEFDLAGAVRGIEKAVIVARSVAEKGKRAAADAIQTVDASHVRATLTARTGIDPTAPPPPRGKSRLPDPDRSTAILLGAGLYPDPAIPDIPAVPHNLADLAAALGDPSHGGFNPSRVHTFPDFGFEDMAHVAELAESTEDTLLVYYAGHGFTDEDGRLHLGLRTTTEATRRYSALDYGQLRRAVLSTGARNRLVMLDCCFSGRAIGTLGGDAVPTGQLDITGTYILTATAGTQLALAPADERHTAFTGALLGVLREGVPDGGPLIRVADLHRELTAALDARARPLPQQRNTDSIGDLAIARNRRG